MQLALKRPGDYSIRAIIDIARHHNGGLRKAREIADEQQIPYKSLTQILANLVAAGLITATHGPTGGYTLARPDTDITLLDIVEVAEGPVELERCVLKDGPCDWDQTCPIHDTWTRAQTGLTRELASTTLADLVAIDANIQAGTHKAQTAAHALSTDRRGNRA